MPHRPPRCPACADGPPTARRPIRHAAFRTRTGRRSRWRCGVCGRTFTTTTGTVYHRLQSTPEEFDRVIQMAIEGMSKAGIARTVGRSVSTITRWLERGARAASRFNDTVIRRLDPVELQIDEIKSFVRRKDQRTYVYTSVEVWSRMWVNTRVGRRTWRNTNLHLRDLRSRCLIPGEPALITTDGYKYYARAVAKVFGTMHAHAQVVKSYRNGRILRSRVELAPCPEHRLERAQARSEDSKTINTSYVERLNLTIRRSLACLQRKSTAYPRSIERLEEVLELLRCYYNFVRPHASLRFGREVRTPAQQAGLVTRRLRLRDVFLSFVPAVPRLQLGCS